MKKRGGEKNGENAEEAARRSNELYRILAEASRDFIFIVDRDLRTNYINDRLAAVLGAPKEEIVGKVHEDLFPRDVGLRMKENVVKVFKTGTPLYVEAVVPMPQGDVWLSTWLEPVRDRDGKIVQVMGVSRDISRLKTAESELREQGRRLEELVEKRTAELKQANEELEKEIAQKNDLYDLLNKRLEFERMVSKISSNFVGDVDMEKELDSSLAGIGRLCGASRCFLYVISPGLERVEAVHEWCADGVSPLSAHLVSLPTTGFEWALRKIGSCETIVMNADDPDPETKRERELLRRLGIKSSMMIPVKIGDGRTGILGVDNVHHRVDWPEDDVALLRVASEIIGAALGRKTAAEAVRDSERRFREMIERSPQLVIEVNAKGDIIFANSAAIAHFGYTTEDLGRNVIEFMPPEDIEADKENLRLGLEGGRVVVETRVVAKDGSIKHILNNSLPVHRKGKFHGLVIFGMDVTERKQAETALTASEKRYAALFDSTPEGVVLADADTGDFKFVNDSFCAMTGYTRSELLEMDVGDLVAGEVREKVIVEFEKMARGEITEARELPLMRKDGARRYMDIVASMALAEDDGTVIGFFKDITERVAAEETLRDHNAFYSILAVIRGVPQNAPEKELLEAFVSAAVCSYGFRLAWFGTHENGRVKPVARAGEVDECVDSLEIDVSGGGSPDAGSSVELAFRNGAPGGFADVRSADENIRWRDVLIRLGCLSSLAVPAIVDGSMDGVAVFYSGAVNAFHKERHDMLTLLVGELSAIISDRRRRAREEMERETLREQLEQAQKMEAIGTLAGGMAHDFNNTLAVIMGSAEMAHRMLTKGDPNAERLKKIIEATRRAKGLTSQLLTFARKGKLEVKNVSVNQMAEEITEILKRGVSKNIQLECNAEKDLPAVKADQNQIHQALLNLCLNAADAMPGGGRLAIETGLVEVDAAALRATRADAAPGRYCMVKISDNGTGIPETIINKIFEPFFTTKDREKGTGLGMSISLGIVRNHGGFIDVKSKVGKGTEVFVMLPATEEKGAREEPSAADAPAKGTETILVIDDDQDLVDMALETLELEGYKPIGATSGEEGLNIFRKHHNLIDLVILDMIMPKMDGSEVFSKLRTIAPSAKVILCSGFSGNVEASLLLERGAKGYIQKPFGLNELCAKIREALGG